MATQTYFEFYHALFEHTFDKALDHWESAFNGPEVMKDLSPEAKESMRQQVKKAREVFLEELIDLTGKIECDLDCGEYEDDIHHDNSPENML